jgi:hypothetical protein
MCVASPTSSEHKIGDFVQRGVHTLKLIDSQRNNSVNTTTILYSKVQTAISDYQFGTRYCAAILRCTRISLLNKFTTWTDSL